MSGIRSLVVTVSTALCALALLALVGLHAVQWLESHDLRYEYKVLAVMSEGHERTGETAMKYAAITPSDTELSALGAEGWEIVGSYLELETAYPNFGDSKYVTGLQPNIRPQRAVILLRRRV